MESTKPMNPIYIDPDSDEEDDENNQISKNYPVERNFINKPNDNKTTSALINSPLAPFKRRNCFEDKTQESPKLKLTSSSSPSSLKLDQTTKVGSQITFKAIDLKEVSLSANEYKVQIKSIKEDKVKTNEEKFTTNLENSNNNLSNDASTSTKTNKFDKPNVNVVFEHGLNKYLCDLMQSHHFKTGANENNLHIVKTSLSFFKSKYGELMEKYCNIVDQIPADYFNAIGGFETGSFLKLKTTRQEFKAQTKLLQEKLEHTKQTPAHIDFNIDDLEANNRCEDEEEEHECGLDDLFNNIQGLDAVLKGGKSLLNNYDYGNFVDQKKNMKEQPPAQRITFAVEDKTPELDDDGFPIYDPYQFELAFSKAASKGSHNFIKPSKITIDDHDDDNVPSTSRTCYNLMNELQKTPEANSADKRPTAQKITVDKSVTFDVKRIHVENLNRIVGYSENVTDCRRAQQLDYYGEHFTPEECLQAKETACNNCLKQNRCQTSSTTVTTFNNRVRVDNSDDNDSMGGDDDREDWNRAAASQGPNNDGSGSGSFQGGKRKRNWRGRGAKKYRTANTFSPRKCTSIKKGFGSPGTRSIGSGGNWIAKRIGASGGFHLMPFASLGARSSGGGGSWIAKMNWC